MDIDLESELVSLISQLIQAAHSDGTNSGTESDSDVEEYRNEKFITIISPLTRIISLVRSADFDASPKKPESKLMSLVTQAISLFNSSMDDIDSLPEPLSKLISLVSRKISMPDSDLFFPIVLRQTLGLEPAPKLVSLVRELVSLVIYMDSNKLIHLLPQRQVYINKGKIRVFSEGDFKWRIRAKWNCFIGKWRKLKLLGGEQEFTHFICGCCNGKYHGEYEKAPIQIKHHLHPKHYLMLVSMRFGSGTRPCYCCDEDLQEVFYYCSACDFAMNLACAEKTLILARDHPKWHEHTLALFPSQASFPCNICALTHSACPFYICPPCDFVVHQKCIDLPRVIRISRHRHRIYFTASFNQGDWFCGVCRRKMDNDYGGYSCVKDGCSYAAHSKCATQSNVWDGIDLDGEPEEIEEEEVEPFVRISDGIIRHFSHECHLLRLDEDKGNDYDDNKLCQACLTPIYFGNFYSCMQCQFVLHETCANLSRKMYHPIHPHKLILAPVGEYVEIRSNRCSACDRLIAAGLVYQCSKEECNFRLHVRCATISEPLVHGSHPHPLFLTSKPEVWGSCCVCFMEMKETFNCIECDGFALCYQCATLPPNARYKHDKHILTLSYGEDTSTVTHWCEVCERKIDLKKGFYTCDEYCCITLHIECLIGRDLYMKPGSSLFYSGNQVDVLSNNHLMSRPFCSDCENRCLYRIVLHCSGAIACSVKCFNHVRFLRMASLF